MNHAKSILIALLLGLLPSLRADQFTASYLFDDGSSLKADFSGYVEEGYVTGIHSMIVSVKDTWWEYNTHFTPTTYNGGGMDPHLSTPAKIALDGSFVDFNFTNFNEKVVSDDDWNINTCLWAANSYGGWTSIYFFDAGGNFEWDANRWSIQCLDQPTVPDSGNIALFLILSLFGLAKIRKSNNQR
jgi:hypothetical protein